MSPNELADQQVRQVAEALKLRIRGAGRTQREVERQLAMGKDYLRQLLSGNMDLKCKHLFAVLAVLGVSPVEFLAGVLGRPAVASEVRPEPGPERKGAPLNVVEFLIRTLHERGLLTTAECEVMLMALQPAAA